MLSFRSWCGVLLACGWGYVAWGQEFRLEPGDRIALIGNTMAERMQHDGWLETFLQLRFPNHQLIFRDLGFSADTVTTRLRSLGFGSPDDHLQRLQADVVMMMFGFNESFAGDAGLARFSADLDAEVTRMLGRKYGKSTPRLVLFSPLPFEWRPGRLPAGPEEINHHLANYSFAIEQVARAHHLPFVDLFRPLRARFDAIAEQLREHPERSESLAPLTINGIHLNDLGNREIAMMTVRALFGQGDPADAELIERVRRAVLDKNFYWFHRYRTTDGYSIFGARGELEFVNRQTNREVMMRELEILDAMTANRDPAIWAAARGEAFVVDDSNTPPFIEVITNIPGPNPDGSHRFLSGEEARHKMKVLDGFEVTLFASEADFPELVNPVQMSFDTYGRLWVAVWPSYPHWKPKDPMQDKLLILEDTTGDGRADRCTVFADGLHNPTGFEFYNGGVLVAQVPDLWFLKDTDGDGRCDVRERILHGLDSADTHHSANSFVIGPDGALYFQEGVFHRTQVETPFGPVRNIDAACYRYELRSGRLEVYTAYPFANPHGHVFDLWGRDIIHDGTGSQPYDAALISTRLDFPHKHGSAPQVYQQRTRPCPATEFVSAGHFPDEMVGQLLVQNVIGDLGILRYEIREDGASLTGRELAPLLLSSDPNFRPVDLEFAPDGSLYFIDWHNPIIGHMQHNLRDPNRDKAHGRVYRVRHRSRELAAYRPEAELSIVELIDRILRGDARSRYRARIELSARNTNDVLRAVDEKAAGLDPSTPEDSFGLLELLWIYQQHGKTHRHRLAELLISPEPRVRAAAVRILTDWRHELSDVDEWWLRAAADPHPRVRLMAARGASYLRGEIGARILATVADGERDRYLDYVLRESLRGIDPIWKTALANADWLAQLPGKGIEFLANELSADELAALSQVVPTLGESLLRRPGLTLAQRNEALLKVARHRGVSATDVLVQMLSDAVVQGAREAELSEWFALIPLQSPQDLAGHVNLFEQWVVNGSSPAQRQAGFLAIATGGQTPQSGWDLVERHPHRFADFAAVVHLVPQAERQWAVYPQLVEAAEHPRRDWIEHIQQSGSGLARFVRIELPGDNRILTLAEVEVVAGGQNVALRGTASQSSVAHGGVATRAIDGQRDGRYGSGGQTHTAESTSNPWWEVQLAENAPVELVRVFNRTEGEFYKRMDGFTLQVFNEQRQLLFERRDLAASRRPIEIPIQLPTADVQIRLAAIRAISRMVGRESEAFAVLTRIAMGEAPTAVRDEALIGLERVAASARDIGDPAPLIEYLLARITQTSETERGRGIAAVATQIVSHLVTQLPADQATLVRQRLGEVVLREFHLETRPHRMAFDKTKLVVAADRNFALILENTDLMPHNWVLVEPGSLEEIGLLAESEAALPDALQKQYVPESPHVLAASRLLQPRETLRIVMRAPSKPGIYPYVCTYPGHWRRMFGAMIVVPSVEMYQSNPDAYLAQLGLEIEDPMLLTINRQQTEWKLSDLAEDVASALASGRDFENGRQMFKLASCLSCHKFAGEGFELGPDLLALPAEWSPVDLLTHILEPSQKIDEKFQTQMFQLVSGITVSGVVVEENEEMVKIVENPLLESSATILKKDDIDARRRSDVSIMPRGLCDSLTKEEIFDLIAYLIAGGDPNHSVYSGK